MLKLRTAQLRALALEARERFVREVFVGLPDVFPGDDRVLDEAVMRELIGNGIDRAATYDIHASGDVTLFVYLLHELGEGFDERPWIRKLLTSKSLDPSERLSLIYQRLEAAQ